MPRYAILEHAKTVGLTLDISSREYLIEYARKHQLRGLSEAVRRIIDDHRNFFSSDVHQGDKMTLVNDDIAA
jgi:hypothetical protein